MCADEFEPIRDSFRRMYCGWRSVCVCVPHGFGTDQRVCVCALMYCHKCACVCVCLCIGMHVRGPHTQYAGPVLFLVLPVWL